MPSFCSEMSLTLPCDVPTRPMDAPSPAVSVGPPASPMSAPIVLTAAFGAAVSPRVTSTPWLQPQQEEEEWGAGGGVLTSPLRQQPLRCHRVPRHQGTALGMEVSPCNKVQREEEGCAVMCGPRPKPAPCVPR